MDWRVTFFGVSLADWACDVTAGTKEGSRVQGERAKDNSNLTNK